MLALPAEEPVATIAECVGKLRTDPRWTDAEIARVQRTVAHIMAEIHRAGLMT